VEFTGRDLEAARLAAILPLIQERMKTLAEFETASDFFYTGQVALDPNEFQAAKKLSPGERVEALKLARSILERAAAIDHQTLEPALREAALERDWKVGDFFMCLRIAITGKRASPPLIESMAVLGREACLSRLERAIDLLG
jgi:glutamyl-tRNA synthetase